MEFMMSRHDQLPYGIKTVAVPGQGTYGFQSVGNTSHTTGFDVYFHPEGMPARAPGYGRMRVVITEDLGWDVEYVKADRLSPDVVKAATEPSRRWLDVEQGALLFSILGAAEIEHRLITRKRDDLTLRHEGRRSWLAREQGRPQGSNEPVTMTPEKVEAARADLAGYNDGIADRERGLKAVIAAIREFTKGGPGPRRKMDEVLEEAREAAFPSDGKAPGP